MVRSRCWLWASALLVVAGPVLADPPRPTSADLTAVIDRRLADGWRENGVTPAPAASDAEFLRRVTLDLAGRIPRVQEVCDFLDDPRPDKRARVVDELLDGPGYSAHFGAVWRRAWLPQAADNPNAAFLAPAFEAWLRGRFRENAPYDRMVRDLITVPVSPIRFDPTGNTDQPPFAFLQANEYKPENLAASVTRLFLGVKIECAQCHNHPFENWTRPQFWQTAAFFAGLPGTPDPRIRAFNERADVHTISIPDSKQKVEATFLDGSAPKWTKGANPRKVLADWVTAPANRYFAKNAVNRLWAYFFGAGFVEPLDEPSDANPPSHPELFDELASAFARSGFDLKLLIRAITASRAYQLSSSAPGASTSGPRTFHRTAVRGLTPEQLFDSLAQATGFLDRTPPSQRLFAGGPRADFLARFASTERPADVQTSILQALKLMNGSFVADATSVERSATLAAVIDAPFMDTGKKVETLFLATVSRPPTDAERTKLAAYVTSGGPSREPRRALADVFWALLNGSEFCFNH